MRTKAFGLGLDRTRSAGRMPTQMEVIRDVMLSAAECAGQLSWHPFAQMWDASQIATDAGWMTLREISELTNFGEASISAQLRHLRKPHFGGYVIVKRRRRPVMNSAWEYRIAGHCECAQLEWLFAGAQM
nr:hypothetical protein [Candidatus Acidoferrales bacterium]